MSGSSCLHRRGTSGASASPVAIMIRSFPGDAASPASRSARTADGTSSSSVTPPANDAWSKPAGESEMGSGMMRTLAPITSGVRSCQTEMSKDTGPVWATQSSDPSSKYSIICQR